MRVDSFLASVFFGLVAALVSLEDLRCRRIPDPLVGTGLIVALMLSSSLAAALTGGALAFSSFLLVRILCRGKLGFGDVKLAGYLGTVLGTRLWWLTVALASVAALLTLVLRPFPNGVARDRSLPFAPFLFLAALASLLLSRIAPSLFAQVAR